MAVFISTGGMLGSPAIKSAAMRAVPSYGDKFRRPQVGMLRPGWDRHIEEVNGRGGTRYGATSLCDMPGAPPCDTGSVQSGLAGIARPLAGLGRITNVACSEHTEVLEKIDNLLAEAAANDLSNMYAAKAAQTYVDRFSGISWQHPVKPSTCATEVVLAKNAFNALSTMLKNSNVGVDAGSYTKDELVPPPPGAPQDIAGTIKTVAIAAAVIAGVVVVAPIVWEGIASLKLWRKARG